MWRLPSGGQVSSTNPNELRVTPYDPLGGILVAELEVVKESKLRHG